MQNSKPASFTMETSRSLLVALLVVFVDAIPQESFQVATAFLLSAKPYLLPSRTGASLILVWFVTHQPLLPNGTDGPSLRQHYYYPQHEISFVGSARSQTKITRWAAEIFYHFKHETMDHDGRSSIMLVKGRNSTSGACGMICCGSFDFVSWKSETSLFLCGILIFLFWWHYSGGIWYASSSSCSPTFTFSQLNDVPSQ